MENEKHMEPGMVVHDYGSSTGRLTQEDSLSQGVKDQPEQQSETLSQKNLLRKPACICLETAM